MTTLSELTLKQLTAIYGVIAEVATSPKTFNTKARAASRLETLLAEKGLTIADALKAADIEIEAEPTAPEPATAPTVATEPAGTNDALPTPEANDTAPIAPPEAEAAPIEETPDAAAILTSSLVINDTRDWLVRYLIDSAKLEPETAVLAALRAVTALKLPEPAVQPSTTPRQPRTGTKQETILALLRRPQGTTLAEIAQTAGNWQPHTVRGFLAGLKKKGFAVTSEKPAGTTERTYRLAAD
ncbi:MAG: DUF3489 domain-containing protein [Rhodospirillaceae bacterium]